MMYAKGSYEQVQWAVRVVRLAGREIASPDEARRIILMKPQMECSLIFSAIRIMVARCEVDSGFLKSPIWQALGLCSIVSKKWGRSLIFSLISI